MRAHADADGFDEARTHSGEPRAHYAELLAALDELDLERLHAELGGVMAARGVTFGEHPFAVCPVPRVLPASEAASLAAGLEQRVRALNAFVVDAYGARRIVTAGRIPERVIDSAAGFEPDLVGRMPEDAVPIGVAGLDLVRGPDGELRVLEDNLRTPSGFAYAVAGAEALRAVLSLDAPAHDDGAGALLGGLAGALRGAAPHIEQPSIAVLTDGEGNAAHFEHALAARHLGAALVSHAQLVRDGDRLLIRDGGRPIDVIYRRSDEDRLYGDDGRPTPEHELLLEPRLAGNLAIVNDFGTGVADDKLAHAYVEEMIGFYVGEEPLLGAVETLDLSRDEHLRRLLEAPEAHVVKPRHGQGGIGVVVCAHATPKDVRRCLAAVRERPEAFVAQPLITLSTQPTVVAGRLAPRHVDLRPFIFSAPGWTRAVPAGLTRVAFDEGSLVVNSSQHGGGKVTWALR